MFFNIKHQFTNFINIGNHNKLIINIKSVFIFG